MYKKYVKVRKRYKAHDATDEYRTGDRVEISDTALFPKKNVGKLASSLIVQFWLADRRLGTEQ